MEENDNLLKLQNILGYRFEDISLLELALTHSSYAYEKKIGKLGCNERIEFLGDAVLELVSSSYLYKNNPSFEEGQLTKLRASLVCEHSLSQCARALHIGEHLRLSKGEETTEGRSRNSILSDALEAIIGAIYLDSGYEQAEEFIIKNLLTDIDRKKLFYDSKTVLQEMLQAVSKEHARYELIDEFGPAHNKTYVTEVHFGERILGQGIGHTKKASEQEAAYRAILMLKKQEGKQNK